MKWITRQRPKVDRLACPQVILRFIDPRAEIIYVPESEVLDQAQALEASRLTQLAWNTVTLKAFHQYQAERKEDKQKMPVLVLNLKEIIQDQIGTNLSLNLKEISVALDVHPTYVSRAFSKYLDNLSFGAYIRKLRIEKAIHLLHTFG